MSVSSRRPSQERCSRVEVVLHRERPAAVEAHDLEGAVAAQQPLVGDGDAGLGRGRDLAVDGRKCHLLRGYRTS